MLKALVGMKVEIMESYEEAAKKCLEKEIPSAALYNTSTHTYECEPFLEQGSCQDFEWRIMVNSTEHKTGIPKCVERPCDISKIPFEIMDGECIGIGKMTEKCGNVEIIRPNIYGFGNYL